MSSDSGNGPAAGESGRDRGRVANQRSGELRAALVDLGSLSMLAVAAVAWLWWGSPAPTESAPATAQVTTAHIAAAAEAAEPPHPEPRLTQLAEAPAEEPEVARVASTTGVNARPCPDAADTCPPIVALPHGSEVQVLALGEGDGTWARVRSREIDAGEAFVVMRALTFATPRG